MGAKTTYNKNTGYGGISKCKKPYTTASTADTDTPRSGSYNTRSNMQVTTKNLLLTSDYHNTRFTTCKNTISVPHYTREL